MLNRIACKQIAQLPLKLFDSSVNSSARLSCVNIIVCSSKHRFKSDLIFHRNLRNFQLQNCAHFSTRKIQSKDDRIHVNPDESIETIETTTTSSSSQFKPASNQKLHQQQESIQNNDAQFAQSTGTSSKPPYSEFEIADKPPTSTSFLHSDPRVIQTPFGFQFHHKLLLAMIPTLILTLYFIDPWVRDYVNDMLGIDQADKESKRAAIEKEKKLLLQRMEAQRKAQFAQQLAQQNADQLQDKAESIADIAKDKAKNAAQSVKDKLHKTQQSTQDQSQHETKTDSESVKSHKALDQSAIDRIDSAAHKAAQSATEAIYTAETAVDNTGQFAPKSLQNAVQRFTINSAPTANIHALSMFESNFANATQAKRSSHHINFENCETTNELCDDVSDRFASARATMNSASKKTKQNSRAAAVGSPLQRNHKTEQEPNHEAHLLRRALRQQVQERTPNINHASMYKYAALMQQSATLFLILILFVSLVIAILFYVV